MLLRDAARDALCLLAVLAGLPSFAISAASTPVPRDSLTGNGNVNRVQLTYSQLFSADAPAGPVDDYEGFAVPANAAAASQAFEGTLTLSERVSTGSSEILRNDHGYNIVANSPWRHLASFSFQFVQDSSYLIPVRQGLAITGSEAWNYLVGTGRVWQEKGDNGYMRASLPFALVERNQNCVHNGEMTFLFSNTKRPNISRVRYQVTQETCLYFKFNMWGQVSATYTPGRVAGAKALRAASALEMANRLPTKSISDLAKDYPKSGIDLEQFTRSFRSPSDITSYGLFIDKVLYVSDCQTRFGTYAFCSEMRLPSYSTAKSSFAGVASMLLGQRYESGVYREQIRDYIPEHVLGGDWKMVTFDNASDMATGNFISPDPQADEASAQEMAFLSAESYATKITDAIVPFPHTAPPGTKWVYQTHTTFLLTQAMDNYLKKRQDPGADIFNAVRDSVFKPLNLSQGSLSTLRTDNSESGRPFGGYGLFFIPDDVVKIAKFLNNADGKIEGRQVLDPVRLQDSLFRSADPSHVGVQVPDAGKPVVPGTFRYHNYFWAKHMTTAEFPQYRCSFWAPFMSGFGGITVLMLPNGVVYYLFSDGNEFIWYSAVNEINKIAPLCH